MAHKEAPLHSNYRKTQLNPWSISSSSGDFQQGGCLYKPISGFQWTPEHLWMSDRRQKQASAKADLSTFGSGVLAIS